MEPCSQPLGLQEDGSERLPRLSDSKIIVVHFLGIGTSIAEAAVERLWNGHSIFVFAQDDQDTCQ